MMIDLQESISALYYYSFLFIVPVVIHLVLFKTSSSKIGIYSLPGWYHILKVWYAKYRLREIKRLHQKALQNLSEEEREKPCVINTSEFTDSYVLYGSDQTGNSINLRIVRTKIDVTVSVIIFLNNGRIYTFPNESKTVRQTTTNHNNFQTAGLNIESLEPFKSLRMTYNGLLRNTASSVIEHVQFNFIWSSAGRPLSYPSEASSNFLADALAREKWRDGDWLRLLGNESGYEQFGAMRGFIAGENFPEQLVLNLASFRKRYFGTVDAVSLHRDFSIVGSAEDGTVFNVGAKSFEHGCTQLRYGSVIYNNMEVHALDASDVTLAQLAEHKMIPDTFVIHFRAKNRNFKCVVHVKKSSAISTRSDEVRGWHLITVPAECDLNSVQAKAVLGFWYKYSGKGDGHDVPVRILNDLVPKIVPNDLVVPLESEKAQIVSITGGKAHSLGLLTSLKSEKFTVPTGFVITVTALQKQLTDTPILSKAVDELQKLTSHKPDDEFSSACARTANLFSQTPISEDIASEIVAELRRMNPTETFKWAVRSSGADEDCEEISAAGQNATYLGCASDDDVLKAVAACWGSLYTYQSVQYRRQRGLPVRCNMGIVVQKMVPSDCAGVLFTCHPATGNPSQMVITSNFGLGESVVSGQADPDTITLHRTWNGTLSVASKQIGQKANVIRMSAKSGTELEPNDASQHLSLTDTQALRLGTVAVHLERAFGGPRDLEWAFLGDQLYLLQSRAVTTVNAWTDFELTHEFDGAVMSEEDTILTKANCGEVMPGAFTALSYSISARAVDEGFQLNKHKCYNPYVMKTVFCSSHHAFIDVINGLYPPSLSADQLMAKVADLAVFGHSVCDEKICTIIRAHNNGEATFADKVKPLIGSVQATWKSSRCVAHAIQLNKELTIHIQPNDTPFAVYDKIERYLKTLTAIVRNHCGTSRSCVFYQVIMMAVLAGKSKELTTDHLTDIALLLSSCESVVSAEIPTALERIASIIRNENLALEFANVVPLEGVEWLNKHCPTAYELLGEFLKTHGHRMFKEFEIMEDNWATKPQQVIGMLQANVHSESSLHKSQPLSVDETLSRLKTPLSGTKRKFLRFLVTQSRKAVGQREQTKSELVRSINIVRESYRALALRMQRVGLLPRKELVHHLTHKEVKKLLTERNPGLILKSLRREKLYPKWDSYTFPEINYGNPIPDQERDKSDLLADVRSSVEANGTPVCSGEIIARACVITSLDEISQLKAGDVLITYCTDIAWSPYFPILGGVITELGGIISHGAVVAREYGLPCIVGVRNATKIFKTGDQVALSGATGIIKKVEL